MRRTAPMALVLYSLIVLWFHQVGHRHLQFPDRPWYPPQGRTVVRRHAHHPAAAELAGQIPHTALEKQTREKGTLPRSSSFSVLPADRLPVAIPCGNSSPNDPKHREQTSLRNAENTPSKSAKLELRTRLRRPRRPPSAVTTRSRASAAVPSTRRDRCPFVRGLKEGNENSRYFAVYALSEIGPGAKGAIPALLELWNSSKDRGTRYFAMSGVVHADPAGEHLSCRGRRSPPRTRCDSLRSLTGSCRA